jgi:hypothetical protein
MAELVIELFEQTIAGLQARPLSAAEQSAMRTPLPPPLLPNNEALPTVCYVGDDFKGLVAASDGFEWLDEQGAKQGTRQSKLGYVASAVGAKLELRLNTSALRPPADVLWATVVRLAHLKSYMHMGTADVSCVRGCKCKASRLDGHHNLHHSQVYYHSLIVDLGGVECVLDITVANETRSGEHKVKLTGVIVHEDRQNVWYLIAPP